MAGQDDSFIVLFLYKHLKSVHITKVITTSYINNLLAQTFLKGIKHSYNMHKWVTTCTTTDCYCNLLSNLNILHSNTYTLNITIVPKSNFVDISKK